MMRRQAVTGNDCRKRREAIRASGLAEQEEEDEALEAVDGHNIAGTYEEAIAAEIAFSRKIEARGWRLVQIGRHRHSRIGHRQWRQKDLISRWRRSLSKHIRRLTGKPAEPSGA